jgi:alcohol dehydrogenase
VSTYSTPKLLDVLLAGQLDTSHMVHAPFALADIMEAYDVFSRPAQTDAPKVLVSRRSRAGHTRRRPVHRPPAPE